MQEKKYVYNFELFTLAYPRETIRSMKYINEYWQQTGGKQLGHIVVGGDTNDDTGREYTRLQTVKDGAYLDDFAVIVSYTSP